MKIIKKFWSKRNNVFLFEENDRYFIKKVFSTDRIFENELSSIIALQNTCVPKIISYEKNQIIMEYISGENLLDTISDFKITDMSSLAISLSTYLQEIKEKNLLPGDLNFRNFIIKNNRCYGIDFEEYKNYDFDLCITRAISFLLLYDNIPFEKKLIFLNAFTNSFNKNIFSYLPLIKNEISFLCRRRNISFDDIFYLLFNFTNS